MIFIWGHTSNCWNCFATYILAVFDPSFLKSCEKSGLHTLNGHTDYIETIVISPDGRNFISGSADKTIRIWDAQTVKLLRTLVEDSGVINYIAIFSNKQKIITACQHGTVKIWGIPNTILE